MINKIKIFLFGQRVRGEKLSEPSLRTVNTRFIPHNAWALEMNVSKCYVK
jgi:hypothetical protein